MANAPFKVIVVGGGPAGLTAAHALSRAGIDFVVLERRSVVVADVGASLVIWPQNLRVLAQLGLWDRLQSIGTEMRHYVAMTQDSHVFKENGSPQRMHKNHGMGSTVFHRAHLMQTLFESLDEAGQSRILTGKKLVDVKSHACGVEAICADGSVYHGSIIIGADGVHSRVRQAMHELALSSSAAVTIDERPFTSTYKTMWFPFPRQPQFAPGVTFEVHGTNVSTQLIIGNDKSWIFVYEKLKTPTQERISYSDEEVVEMANRWGELYIAPNLVVKDVFPTRYTAGMVNVEEGVVKHWSWDSMVLVGDACHKSAPNLGLGFNNGIQDVVALVNELQMTLATTRGRSLDAKSLAAVFARYQASRMKQAQKDHNFSAGLSRMAAWDGWLNWLLDRYILSSIPGFDEFLITKFFAGPISRALILNSVQVDEPFQGKVPWKHALIASSTDSIP